jgi:serine/threonine-protein kinase
VGDLSADTRAATAIRTLLVCDLVASTRLVERIGDEAAAALLAAHDRAARELLAPGGGREIDKSDGFLLIFERPIQAVRFALAYQRSIRSLGDAQGVPLTTRAGIHFGEVVLRENPAADVRRGAKPLEVEGLAKAVAARVASLAAGGRILLTRAAFDLARRGAVGAGGGDPPLRWAAHGRYQLAGIEEAVEVFEVAEPGDAALAPPGDSEKARRVADESTIVGWRPAPGVEVPGRPNWLLARKLGEGGFGESWLAEQRGTREPRVFKFCYDARSLRGLRREITLFRLLKETLGERRDITRVLDWKLDEAPYFIESEYSAGGNLADWAEAQGGIAAVPLAQRIEIAAQVAEALAAAHSVGVLHKDVKPANVLIVPDAAGAPRAQLADFGIGMLLGRDKLAEAGITFRTDLLDPAIGSSGGGTFAYLAPEILEGKPVTLQADVYALGVLLFQLVAGDFTRVMAPGWERDVEDELLREEIAAAVDGNPQRRSGDALRIAERLRALEPRRAERAVEREARREAEAARIALARGRRRRRLLAGAAALSLAFGIAMALQARRIEQEAERANREATTAQRVADILVGLFQVSDPGEARGNSVTAREILDRGAARIETELAGEPLVRARLMGELGRVYQKLGLYWRSEELLKGAGEAIGAPGTDAREVLRLRILHDLANTYWFWARWQEAEATYLQVIEGRTRSLGPDHPDTLAARSDLASAYLRQERLDEAERLSLEVLAAQPGASGGEAVALGNLTEVYTNTGRLDEAEETADRLIALLQERSGSDHPETLAARGYLAGVYAKQGRLAEAEQTLVSAIAGSSRVLGGDHPETLGLRYELAGVYETDGRLADAEVELRAVLARDRTLLGDAHAMVADERIALACVLLKQDRRDEALALLRENVAHAHSPVPDRASCRAFRDDPEITRLAAQAPAGPRAE